MNILIYFGDQLCPTGGGTERVACLLSDYLNSKGANILYLACRHVNSHDAVKCEFLPDSIEAPTQNNIKAVNGIIEKHKIDVIINEGGFGEVARLFSHEHIPTNIKIISHLHFDPLRKHYYKGLFLPLSFNRQGLRNLMTWIKSPYHKIKFIQHIRTRFKYILENSDSVITLCPKHSEILNHIVSSCHINKIHALYNPLTFNILPPPPHC